MKILTFVFLALFVTLPAYAQDRFLDIQEVRSPGGISAWLVEDHSLPVISLRFAFRDAGAANDPQTKQGQTQLLSNTMDEGAGELDSQSFQKQLNDNSITLRFTSSRDSFGGNLKTLKRTQNQAFNLLKLALTQPRFDAEPLERMKQSNITRIKSSLSDPQWKAARLTNDIVYEGHPYALNSGGTLSTLPKITADDLRNIINKRLGKDRLFVSVTGAIGPEELTLMLDDVFGSLPETSSVQDVPVSTIQNTGHVVLYEHDIPQSIIDIKIPAFGRDDPDYYALQVMNYILGGGGFGSRLMEEIREKRGLTYGIYSNISDTRKIDALSISTSTNNDSVLEMLSVIRFEIDRLRTEGVTKKELKDAKSYLTGSMPLALSSTDRIAGMLLSLQMQDLPINYLDSYSEKIKDVSQKDILRVAERVLKSEDMTTILVGKPLDIDTTQTIATLPNVE
ncbi:MAG: pitrilysin family protein [Pseudomonadota bacterium]